MFSEEAGEWVYCMPMGQKLLNAFYASLEWRIIAFFISNIFFWFTTHSFWQAAGLALVLQAVLFVVHTFWYFVRHERGFEHVGIFSRHHRPEL